MRRIHTLLITMLFALSASIAATGCAVDDGADLDEVELETEEAELTAAAAPTLSVRLVELCTNFGPMYGAELSGSGGFTLQRRHGSSWSTLATSTSNYVEFYGSTNTDIVVRGCRGTSCSTPKTARKRPPCDGGGGPGIPGDGPGGGDIP